MRRKNFTILNMSLSITFFCYLLLVNGDAVDKKYDEESGKAYLKSINAEAQNKTTENVLASWAYESNITDENLRNQLDVAAKVANYTKEIWKETIKFPWKTFKDPDVRRQFEKFSHLGTAILSPEKYEKYNKIVSDMQSIYGKAKICNYFNRTDCNMQLEPELTEIFSKSRDPEELQYYWEQWRNTAGKPVRKMFKEYVILSNEAAVLNNFTNNADSWLDDYEVEDFKNQLETLWQQLRPLYLQLHAYVRRRLREQYGEKHVPKRGPIPAHLLGNMWGQSWSNTFDFTVPYPQKPSLDVTPNMVEQGYTPLRMFKLAEEFFTSLNLSPMPDTFWQKSILEKPKDGRDLICHASAWDFYDGKDFRIKQCTRITMENLNTVHHEMGHIQYFLQYKNQPLVYKEGANPGFHEAVGDVMALSVSTPKHLRKIGLLNITEDDTESEINQLFNMALDKIAFLPFGYLMDQWRWSVFEGEITEKNYNCKWWQLREKYQGLSPSVIRSEADFDPGAKYHIVGNVPYIRYFVSFVIQFQFHRSLCIAAKEFDPNNQNLKPLHKCDIYQSKEAGALLQKMLQMGSSKPWPDAMEVITGQRAMDAQALLDYFATLQIWLEKENKKTGEYIGWESSNKECEWNEEESNIKSPSSETEGSFGGSNIAYTYAEFVRQEDNSFGVPDYIEEVKPSYYTFLHKQEKTKLLGHYFLPTKKTISFKKRNFDVRNESSLQSENDIINISKLQHLKQKIEKQSKIKLAKENIKNNPALKKHNYNEAFEVRSKSNELDKMKILNNILKDFRKIRLKKDSYKYKIGDKEMHKTVSCRETAKKEKKSENTFADKKKVNKKLRINENRKVDTKSDEEEISLNSESDGGKFFKSKKKNLSTKANNKENKETNRNAYCRVKEVEGTGEGKAECILEKAKIFKQKNFDFPNIELMWKAEMVKNEAEKMLKDFNFSAHDSNIESTSISDRTFFSHSHSKDFKTSEASKKTRAVLIFEDLYEKDIGQKKNIILNLNSFEPLLKSTEFGILKPKLRNRKHSKNINFKEYYLNNIIKVNNRFDYNPTLFVIVYKLRQNIKCNKKIKKNDQLKNLILVAKLMKCHKYDMYNKKKYKKKSFKEFHFNARTPVIYNAVVVTLGGKNEKSVEAKDFCSKISKTMKSSLKSKIFGTEST